jgi:predicted ATP-dependent endonuclease of OLD family
MQMDFRLVNHDEPEIHLHPSWIRQLYLALPKIGDDNQYVLTTHSPELRQRAVSNHALIDLGELDQRQ